jgi:hypothetical protein
MCLIRPFIAGFLLVTTSFLGPEPLLGQESREVEIRGRVLDARTSEPVPGATVMVLDSYGEPVARRVAGDLGEFTLEVRRLAGIRLQAHRIGYATVETPFLDFGGHHFFVIDIHMDVEAVLLAPLEVVARGRRLERSPLFEGFDHRRQLGFGSFFTRAEIETLRPLRVTDLLLRIPGVSLSGSGAGHRRIVTMNRTPVGRGGGACPVQIFMDGMLVTRATAGDVSLDELVTPETLEGMEVYRGLSTVPAEFLNSNAHCGVVALWTRRGGPGGGTSP